MNGKVLRKGKTLLMLINHVFEFIKKTVNIFDQKIVKSHNFYEFGIFVKVMCINYSI